MLISFVVRKERDEVSRRREYVTMMVYRFGHASDEEVVLEFCDDDSACKSFM